MVELRDGEKNFADMCNRLDRIPACDGQTDGRTNWLTDRRTDILPQRSPCYAYASRGKNGKRNRPLEFWVRLFKI